MALRYHACWIVTGALLLAGASSPARAGWTPDGATIKSTTASIPLVEACSDGANGTFVTWQEEVAPGQLVLRAQHVLATGDVDPAWPAEGAIACSVPANRTQLGVLPDHVGGLYLWWVESALLTVNHLDAVGLEAPGWVACGTVLGEVYADSPSPCVVEDGAHGLYLAWSNVSLTVPPTSRPVLVRLQPDGSLGADEDLAPASRVSNAYYPQVALAPDGGAFAAWGTWSSDTTRTPSDWCIRRLLSDGSNAAGWPIGGIIEGRFGRDALGNSATSGLLAVAPDGGDGVYMMAGFPQVGGSVTAAFFHLQGNGQSEPGWPAGGVQWSNAPPWYVDTGADGSYRLLPDGRGDALAGTPVYYDHGSIYWFGHVGPGPGVNGWMGGQEFAPKNDGGMWFATFHGTGPYGMYDLPAYLSLSQVNPAPGWSDFYVEHPEPATPWFGDIGLAPTLDQGCVFFWSQVNQRYGLFARRFSTGGQVTAVAPAVRARLGIRALRFVHGTGVRATVTLPEGTGKLALFDVAGRRVASADLPGPRVEADVTLAGTQALAPGLYFARLTSGRGSAGGRLLVLR